MARLTPGRQILLGLLKSLKSIERTTTLSEYSGQTVAVDGYAWLHKASVGCSMDLARGKSTTVYIDYVLRKVQMLLDHGVTPYMVFDGDYLPTKASTEEARSSSREAARKKGLELLEAGNNRGAFEQFQKAVDVTPTMAAQIIHQLKKLNLPYVVAPYEADAQMVYLESRGIVQAIISEDSDLLIFGATRLLTKLNDRAELIEINRTKFPQCRELFLADFSLEQLRIMAILSGCDYSDGIPKIGIKTANRFVRKYKTSDKILRGIRLEGSYTVPSDFEKVLSRADLTFQHQRVYCIHTKKLIMLNDPNEPISDPDFDNFIGTNVDDRLCRQIALGNIDPISKSEIRVDTSIKPMVTLAWKKSFTTKQQSHHPKSIRSFFTPTSDKKPPVLAQKSANFSPPAHNNSSSKKSLIQNRAKKFLNKNDDSGSDLDDDDITNPHHHNQSHTSQFFKKTYNHSKEENKENQNPASSDGEVEDSLTPTKKKRKFTQDSSDSDLSPVKKQQTYHATIGHSKSADKAESFPPTPTSSHKAAATSSTPIFKPGFFERFIYKPKGNENS